MVRYAKINLRLPTVLLKYTMMSRLIRSVLNASRVALPAALAVVLFVPSGGYAQSITVDDELLNEPSDLDEADVFPDVPTATDDFRPLAQDGTILSISGGQRLIRQAQTAVSNQDYDTAVSRLQQARQVFNQLSNFYQQLSGSFSGVDSRISDDLRAQALETAQMRDQATFQLALVHRAQNQPELAVPLLIQIIRSQQPTRELGQRAYQQLFELGFVNSPYPRESSGGATNVAPTVR
jgi:hypothetical protein